MSRTPRTFILLSALVVLSACSNDQDTTAPTSSRSLNAARPTAVGDARVASQVVVTQGKPVPTVGFTKVDQAVSTWTFNPGANGFAHTDCPAGTTAIGGGFGYDLGVSIPTVPPPGVIGATIVGNGWQMFLANNQPGAITWTIEVAVYCAS
jgi:hypothetical protein